MSAKFITNGKDSDLRASIASMRRAVELIRETAFRTDANVVIAGNDQLFRIPEQYLREIRAADTKKTA